MKTKKLHFNNVFKSLKELNSTDEHLVLAVTLLEQEYENRKNLCKRINNLRSNIRGMMRSGRDRNISMSSMKHTIHTLVEENDKLEKIKNTNQQLQSNYDDVVKINNKIVCENRIYLAVVLMTFIAYHLFQLY